ncbi:hypothetical protein F3Y22_tig00110893pilonHSYRG00660 [Hibiscus syriacus]|uniref:Secreted protein n=1 Tax=Hibiscus syriacus TaxID=106335 RepID=A0A6A2ZIA4_HIBSY|nr:hypothetical protein F3Y22_tig00110893pilonHSYRG00660 [Hibiscus syriacus]
MRAFRGVKTSNGGSRAAVFFFWTILICSQLGQHLAVHEDTSGTHQQSFKVPQGKLGSISTVVHIFTALHHQAHLISLLEMKMIRG